jgi:uncharacterized membrane protein
MIFSLMEGASAEITTGSALTISVKVNSPHVFVQLIVIALVNLKNESLLSVPSMFYFPSSVFPFICYMNKERQL